MKRKGIIIFGILLISIGFLFYEGLFTSKVFHPFAPSTFYIKAIVYRYHEQTIFSQIGIEQNSRYALVNNPSYLLKDENSWQFYGTYSNDFELNELVHEFPIHSVYPELLSKGHGVYLERRCLTDEEFDIVLQQFIHHKNPVCYYSIFPFIGPKLVTPEKSVAYSQIWLVDFTEHPDNPTIIQCK